MDIISVKDYCLQYDMPQSFIESLFNYDLIHLVEVESILHIEPQELNKIERFRRIHYDLEVNMEGLDIISNLLDQIDSLQEEMRILKNRISFYE